jgi:hypothetical protein
MREGYFGQRFPDSFGLLFVDYISKF